MAGKLKQECLTLFPEVQDIVKFMTDEQLGMLLRAILRYRFLGEASEFDDPVVGMAYHFLSNQVDRMEDLKKHNTELANRRWAKRAAGAASNASPAPLSPALPTVDTAGTTPSGAVPELRGILVDADLDDEEDFPF